MDNENIEHVSQVAIVTIPTNLGASRSGEIMGRSSTQNMLSNDLQCRLQEAGVSLRKVIEVKCPPPHLDLQNNGPQNLKNINEIVEVSEEVARIVEEQRREGRIVIAIGGDHSISLGTVPGIVASSEKSTGVLIIDRHLDFNTDETTPSGNIHGMPVAAYTGFGNKKLVNIYRKGRKVRPTNVLILGVNDPDTNEDPAKDETMRAANAGIKTVTISEFKHQKRRMAFLLKKIDALRRKVGQLHVSLDVDGLDQTSAPGTPMKNPDGFTAEELLEIAKHLRRTVDENGKALAPVVGIEVAEFSPALDDETTEKTGFLVRRFIASALDGSKAGKMAPIKWVTADIEGHGPMKFGYY